MAGPNATEYLAPNATEYRGRMAAGCQRAPSALRCVIQEVRANEKALRCAYRVVHPRAAFVIAMGDFNFDASTEQYRQTAAALDETWVTAQERVVDPGASDPGGRIDHIFVSRNTCVVRCRYIPEGPSDHPGVLAELAW